jgi:PAS domain S-box-containing protein
MDTFKRNLTFGFIAASVLLIAITLVSYRAIKDLQRANGWVAHTLEVIAKTNKASAYLEQAQQQLALSLLNKKLVNASHFDSLSSNVHIELNLLRKLVSDNQPQVKRIDSLIKYSNLELDEDQKPFLAQSPSILIAQQNLLGCRGIVLAIISEERRLLTIRKKVGENNTVQAIESIIVFAAISAVLLALLYSLITRTFNEKRHLTERLELSESKFANIFKDSGIGMAIVSLKGQWLEVNPYLTELLGYSKDELIKKTFQEITFLEDLDKDLAFLRSAIRGEIGTYKVEKRYYHKKGHLIWVMITVSLIRNTDYTPRFFVVQIEDITKVKAIIAELEFKNDALILTSTDLRNKINQLEEFNGIVAHNLRGPAGSISMMLDMLQQDESPEENRELLCLITQSSKALNSTLDDLMQVLEVRLNQFINFDNCVLADVLDKTCHLLKGEIIRTRANIQSDFEVEQVKFPRIYLESIFYNLISNSLKYSRQDVPVNIRISACNEEGKIKLVFEDNGLGIDLIKHAQDVFKLNKVFHKGFDSKGVGLFITKNQLETHGGSITVESEPLIGSKFIVHI